MSGTAKLRLAADGHTLLLSLPPQRSDAFQAAKQLGAQWQPAPVRSWRLPTGMHDQAVAALAGLQPPLSLAPLPRWLLAELRRPQWDMSHKCLLPPPTQLDITPQKAAEMAGFIVKEEHFAKLLQYQIRGVLCAIAREGRVLWGDEMGLGKTVQALTTCLYYQREWPVLIICPSSLALTWASEIEKWLGLDDSCVKVVSTGKDSVEGVFTIVSYNLAQKLGPKLKQAAFRVIVCDEAHYLKNDKAKRTEAILPLLQAARRVLLLTGTPALSRPIELHNLLLGLLGSERCPTKIQFGQRYCNSYLSNFGWQHQGSCNEEELYAYLSRTVMIRREKATVLSQLPPKQRQTIFVDCAKSKEKEILAQMKRLTEVDRRRLALSGPEREVADNEYRALTSKLYGLTGLAKLPACLEFLEEHLERGTKMLVFAHHQDVLNAIMERLCKLAIRHIRIDGSTPADQRQQACDKFQSDADCLVALLSITAAGTGLTLHAASTVVFVELFWNPGQLFQAEDRVHRVGQQNHCIIKYLICKNTLDDMMWHTVQEKTTVVDKTLRGGDQSCSPPSAAKYSPLPFVTADSAAGTASTTASKARLSSPTGTLSTALPTRAAVSHDNPPPTSQSSAHSTPLRLDARHHSNRREAIVIDGEDDDNDADTDGNDDILLTAVTPNSENLPSGFKPRSGMSHHSGQPSAQQSASAKRSAVHDSFANSLHAPAASSLELDQPGAPLTPTEWRRLSNGSGGHGRAYSSDARHTADGTATVVSKRSKSANALQRCPFCSAMFEEGLTYEVHLNTCNVDWDDDNF